MGCLLFYSMRQTGSVLLNGIAEFAFAFQQFNSAQYAFFERLKIVCGHGHLGRVFCEGGHRFLITLKGDGVLDESIDRKFRLSIRKTHLRYLRLFLRTLVIDQKIVLGLRYGRDCLRALTAAQRFQGGDDCL